MNLTLVDVGVAPNDGTGDNIRDAFIKVNQNTQTLNSLLYENTEFASALITSLTAVDARISNSFRVLSGTDCPEIGTAAAVIDGGLSVAKDTRIGGNVVISKDLTVDGDLTVNGNVTTLNTSTLAVEDLNITLAKDATTPLQANTAGFTVSGANATITYNNLLDGWEFNKTIYANINGLLLTNAQPNITSVGTLAGLTVSGLTALGNVTASMVSTSNVQVTGGKINGTPIGATSPSTGAFSTLSAVNGITGTLQTNAQPNITSVGTLGNLAVNGTITANYINLTSGAVANLSVMQSGNVQITGGTITNTPISGSTGSFTTLTATTGNVTTLNSTTINGQNGFFSNTVTSTMGYNGVLLTNAQPNITSVGTLTTLATSGNATIGTDLVVGGNLTVQGTSTTLNVNSLDVEDVNITVAKGAATAAAANGAGITVDGPAGATITYTSANDRWNMNRNLVVPTVFASLSGNVATSSQPYITSVGTLTSLNTSGNITVGSNFVIANLGKGIYFADGSYQDTKYVLPTASNTILGGVKVGAGLLMDVNGILSVNSAGGSQSYTDLVVTGNLTVQGTATYLSTATLEVADNNILVAKGATTSAAANGAGITVDGPAAASISYEYTTDRWVMNKNLTVAQVIGNATTANTLATTRTISAGGAGSDATWSVNFNGGSSVSSALTLANTAVTSGQYGSASNVAQITVDSKGRATSAANVAIAIPSSAVTDATSLPVPNTIVKRDSLGNFSGNVITANLLVGSISGTVSGNSETATKLVVARNIALSGDVTGNVYFDGSADVTIPTVASSSVVKKDASGNFSANTITASLNGNASTASKWLTTRYLTLSGDVSGNVAVDGSGNMAMTATVADDSHNHTSAYITDATSAATASVIVKRDALGNFSANTVSVISITHSGTSGTGDIGSAANKFGTFYGTASTALYADLAERYESDSEYAVGTVVVFGGEKEITQSAEFADVSVAGVISDKPSYLMNSECNGPAVALRGKVPVRVIGPVRKGDLLVSSNVPGCAISVGKEVHPLACFAKAIESSDVNDEKLIYAVVI